MKTMNEPMQAVDVAIRARKTCKVLSNSDLPVRDMRAVIEQLIELAGKAPFHRPCDESYRRSAVLDGIEPWRFHAVDAANCRRMKQLIPLENAGKIPAMLAAADALLLATWLPNPSPRYPGSVAEATFEPSLANMEHIAAASAAVQNLLLAATARGIASYWSSGGVLRSDAVFQTLEISTREILLGAIFLFPSETLGAEVVGSKLRENRTSSKRWSRWASWPMASSPV